MDLFAANLAEKGVIRQTAALAEADAPALDALLTKYGLAAAYARSHLRARGLRPGGVRAWGWPPPGPPGAALVIRDGVAWACWREDDGRAALAARLATLGVQLLSGPADMVAPLLADLGVARHGPPDRCPYEILTPATFQPATGPDGSLARRAGFDDMEALIDFYRPGFYSLAYLPTRAAWRDRLTEQLTHRTIFVIEQGGRILAAAQSSAQTPDLAMIGGVATLPDYRNRGLSRACTGALCTHLFAAGCGAIGLFYMRDNWPAAHVYAHLGFRPAGEWWLTRLMGDGR
jgi:ribosomal protein S18 acetylase RimI-like enzyme